MYFSACLDAFCCFPHLILHLVRLAAVGSLMLDARLGFYEEPMSDVAVKFMQAVEHFLDSMCKLETRYDRIVYKYVNTPAWNKFAGALDTFMEIGQEFIDKKLNEIKAGIDSGAFDDGKYGEDVITSHTNVVVLSAGVICHCRIPILSQHSLFRLGKSIASLLLLLQRFFIKTCIGKRKSTRT